MAGDWIKVRHALPDDPAVIAMAAELSVSENEVVGALIRMWIWADRHLEDGHARGVTQTWLNRYVGVTGFAESLYAVGWLAVEPDTGISFPKFERHMSQSAKSRALAALRKAASRNKTVEESRSCHGGSVTKTGPEKRREECSSSSPPKPPPEGEGAEGGKEEKSPEIPEELAGLELYAADPKLCGRWPQVYPLWVETYPRLDVLSEVRLAHAWEVEQEKSKRKKMRVAFLGKWLRNAQKKLERGDRLPNRTRTADREADLREWTREALRKETPDDTG